MAQKLPPYVAVMDYPFGPLAVDKRTGQVMKEQTMQLMPSADSKNGGDKQCKACIAN